MYRISRKGLPLTCCRSSHDAGPGPQAGSQTTPADPMKGTEAAANEGGDPSRLQSASDAHVARVVAEKQASLEARQQSSGVVEPAAEEEDSKVPVTRDEEARYRGAFGQMIHILEFAV